MNLINELHNIRRESLFAFQRVPKVCVPPSLQHDLLYDLCLSESFQQLLALSQVQNYVLTSHPEPNFALDLFEIARAPLLEEVNTLAENVLVHSH